MPAGALSKPMQADTDSVDDLWHEVQRQSERASMHALAPTVVLSRGENPCAVFRGAYHLLSNLCDGFELTLPS